MIKTNYKPRYPVAPEKVREELGKKMLVDGFDLILDLENSHDSKFIDSRNKREYLDFFTCFASMPIGMNHPKLKQDSFTEYLGEIAVNKPSNSDIYTEVMASFVKTFSRIGHIEKFDHLFFISGGALAVENALKTAFDWKVRKNFAKGFKFEKGSKIIHFRQAFHGRSGYTMSLTNTDPNKIKYFPKFDWPRIFNPKIKFPLNDRNLEQVIIDEEKSVNEIKKAFADNPDDIAAIIIEPIQGEGGDNHFRAEFLKQLRLLADENEALLIFDEIQTGVGITGKMWAHQNFSVVPDIMCFGKKMQVCGIAVTKRVDEIEDNVFRKSSRINSTWGGNLVDMARSTKYLEIIEEENLIENAEKMGSLIIENIHGLSETKKGMISNIRGLGMFCAFDLKDADTRNRFASDCFNEGLIILPCGQKSIRFRPALNINKDNLELGFEIIRKALNKIKL